jgi:hypothetical protein
MVLFESVFWADADVLPPGQGRVVGVDVVGFMPVGRDVLLAFFSIPSE